MSIQTTVVPQDRIEGVRCFIVQPGDALILSGISAADANLADALATVKEALSLRLLLICRDLTEVSVRDLDAELAEAQRQLESYGKLFELNSKTLNGAIDRMHAAEARVAELEAEKR